MTSTDVELRIQRHWALSNQRDWTAFGALLHPDLRYDCPQTREYIDGAAGYLAMFSTWPGDWSVQITQLVCSATEGVSIIRFSVGAEVMTGISVFGFLDGLIARVTDYWPEPYEPPPRATPYLQRRPA